MRIRRDPSVALVIAGVMIAAGALYFDLPLWLHRNRDIHIEPSAPAPQYRYDAERTGVAPGDATAGPGRKYRSVWITRRLNRGHYGASKSTPAVNQEAVLVGTDRGTVVSVRRADGVVQWEFAGHPSEQGIHGSPALDESKVYVGDYAGYMYALDQTTGHRIWESRPGDHIGSSPVLYGRVLLVGVELAQRRCVLVGLDRRTGNEVFRSVELPDLCHSSPAIDAHTGSAYLGDNSGGIYRWNLGSLAPDRLRRHVWPAWRFSAESPGGDVKSTPALWEHLVVATSWDAHVYGIDKQGGRLVWRFRTRGKSMSSPAVDASRRLVVAGSHDGQVYGLDVASGRERWRFDAGGWVMSSATLLVGEGVGLIGSSNSRCHLFDLDSGSVLQSLRLYSGLTGVPVAVGSHLYLFDDRGYLYAFTSNDGR